MSKLVNKGQHEYITQGSGLYSDLSHTVSITKAPTIPLTGAIGDVQCSQPVEVQSEALKFDENKIDWSLLPIEAMEEVIKVFMYGERKYARFNYRLGFDTNRLVAANMRHLLSWQKGENLDPETQLSHIAHNVCTGLMLLQNIIEGKATDGRYKP